VYSGQEERTANCSDVKKGTPCLPETDLPIPGHCAWVQFLVNEGGNQKVMPTGMLKGGLGSTK